MYFLWKLNIVHCLDKEEMCHFEGQFSLCLQMKGKGTCSTSKGAQNIVLFISIQAKAHHHRHQAIVIVVITTTTTYMYSFINEITSFRNILRWSHFKVLEIKSQNFWDGGMLLIKYCSQVTPLLYIFYI